MDTRKRGELSRDWERNIHRALASRAVAGVRAGIGVERAFRTVDRGRDIDCGRSDVAVRRAALSGTAVVPRCAPPTIKVSGNGADKRSGGKTLGHLPFHCKVCSGVLIREQP